MSSERSKTAGTSNTSNDVVISAEGISKCYHIYPGNKARLRQIFFSRKKYYEEFWALKDISVEIKRGEAIGIIGPNGAGKSTFLQVIAGILKPTEGRIHVNGRVSAMLELGAGFDAQYTGRENAYLNGAIMGLSRKEMDRKLSNIIEFADIGDFFERPVWMYSSGMVARLAFAVAVNMEPDILVVDEVLSVGDMAFQRKCNEHIVDLQKSNVSIIYVSHALPTVENLCSRAILLDKGQVARIGASSEVVRHYQKIFDNDRFVPGEAIMQDVSRAFGDREPDGPAVDEFLDELDEQRLEFSAAEKHPYQTGEIELRSIMTLNEKDEPCDSFACSDRLKVRVEYYAKKKIVEPVFAVHVYNSKGIFCLGTRTKKSGVSANQIEITDIEGEGWFEVDFGSIRLNSDTYVLSVAIFDLLIFTPYAFDRSVTFHVTADSWNSVVGVKSPIWFSNVKWDFSFRQLESS
jgi:lipopolysaccharide transport system ATP-binding protein